MFDYFPDIIRSIIIHALELNSILQMVPRIVTGVGRHRFAQENVTKIFNQLGAIGLETENNVGLAQRYTVALVFFDILGND